MSRNGALSLFLVLQFALNGCGCANRSSKGGVASSIGPEGGHLELTRGQTVARLDVPPGALLRPVELSMDVFPERLPEASGPTIELRPHGTRFEKPVTLSLSLPRGVAGIVGRPLHLATQTDEGWEYLPTTSPAPGVLSGTTTHFSLFSLVSPCVVAGTGTTFSLPGCRWSAPAVTSSVPVELTLTAAQVTISISLRGSNQQSFATLEVTGLRPNWTYYAVGSTHSGPSPMATDSSGRLVLTPSLMDDVLLVLMEHHGSFTLTPSSCSQIGHWDSATNECRLTQDVPDPPIYVPEDVITLNCQDPVTALNHTLGSSTQGSIGIYAFPTSAATGNSVVVKNCNIRNVDFGVHAALPGFRAESISMENDSVEPNGTGVTLGAGQFGTGASLEAIRIQNFEVGVNADSALGVSLRDLTVRVGTSAFVGGGDIVIEDAHVEGLPDALDGGTIAVGAISLMGSGEPVLRRVSMTNLQGLFAGVWASGGATASIEESSVEGAAHGIVFDGPASSSLTGTTVAHNGDGVWIRVGGALIFHNNIYSNQVNARSAAAIELSDERPTSTTAEQGNYWGHACPAALFVGGIDSNDNAVVDSHPFAEFDGWDHAALPGCSSLQPPTLAFPTADLVVASRSPMFHGTVAPDATVELFESGTMVGSDSTTASGLFEIAPEGPMPEGRHEVQVRARTVTRFSGFSPTLAFTIDLNDDSPPAAPVFLFPTNNAVFTDTTVPISGLAEPDSKVLVTDGAKTAVTVADRDGGFLLTLPFSSGTYTISALAEDAAGNRSPPSAVLLLTVRSATQSAPVTDSSGKLRVTSITDAYDPFVPALGEVNTLAIGGEMVRAPGAQGNHSYQISLRREVLTTSTGAVVTTFIQSLPIATSTSGQRIPFGITSEWNGRLLGGEIAPAGPYVSDINIWIVRDPVPPGTPSPPGPLRTCGPVSQPVVGACKEFELPPLRITHGLLDAPPPVQHRCSGSWIWWSRAESCNGIDDNCNGSVDEGAACVARCSP